MADDGHPAAVRGRFPGSGPRERLDARERRPREVEAVRGERDADRVEDEVARPHPHLAGDVVVPELAREPR